MSAPRTARERVKDEVTGEILAAARAHLAREGAAALSLRSIARELGMAPSALYRYFSSRDALLSALILGAYGSLADQAEHASEAAYAREEGAMARWVAVPRAMRSWAYGHPHEWGLIFGSPVPGYEAPTETITPYTRLAQALVRPIIEAHQHGSCGELAPVCVVGVTGDGPAGPGRPARGRRPSSRSPHRGRGAGTGSLCHPDRDHQPRALRPLAQHGAGAGGPVRSDDQPPGVVHRRVPLRHCRCSVKGAVALGGNGEAHLHAGVVQEANLALEG